MEGGGEGAGSLTPGGRSGRLGGGREEVLTPGGRAWAGSLIPGGGSGRLGRRW